MADKTLPMDDSPVQNIASPQNGPSQGQEGAGRQAAGAGGTSDWQISYPTHKERFMYLLDSGINSDVILRVGKNELPIKAHKLILSTGSPVFRDLILAMESDQSEITLSDVEPERLQPLLDFLYTGTFEVDLYEETTLIVLANKFQVPDLAKRCVELLELNMCDEIAPQLFELAGRLDQKELGDSALNHIRRNARNLLETNDFLTLTSNNLCRLLEDDKLEAANEMQVYEAALRWAKARCQRDGQKATPHDMQMALKDVIQHVRFPQMDVTEFCLRVAKSGILKKDQLVLIFMYLNTPEPQRKGIFPLDFNKNPRKYYEPAGKEFTVNCFSVSCNSKRTAGGWDRIAFQVGTPMWVVAFAINAFSTSTGENLNKGNGCEIEIKLEDSVLQTICGSKMETMAVSDVPYYCEFDKPVRIAPNTLYIASVFVQGPNLYSYVGEREKTTAAVQCEDAAVNFKFQDANVIDDPATGPMKQLHEITFMLT